MRILRAASAGWGEIQNFLPKLWGLARQLFNEIMGIAFLALSVFFIVGAQGLIQTYRSLDANPEDFPKLLLLCLPVVMFALFGFSSFRRARKIAREK